MTHTDRMKALEQLAGMIRDHDMARLQQLGAQRDRTRSRIAALSKPPAPCEDPIVFTAQQAHARWAANQRMQLNMVLAQETALLLEQRSKAMRSFGRVQALAKLRGRTWPTGR